MAGVGERVFKVFRSVIQLHQKVSYLFAGSQETLMNKIFIDKSGAFYRFGQLIYLYELTKHDVFTYIQETYPSIAPEILFEIAEFTKCHPYYIAQIVEHFAYDENYYVDMNGFYEYISEVLVPQERSYIELQLMKIKEKANALDVLRVISMNLNVYSEIKNIARQNLSKILAFLENAGHVKKIGRANYVLTDPMIGYYLNNY